MEEWRKRRSGWSGGMAKRWSYWDGGMVEMEEGVEWRKGWSGGVIEVEE